MKIVEGQKIMRIRFINFLILNCGFSSLLTLSLFVSCSEQTKNPSFQVVNNVIEDWNFDGDSAALSFVKIDDVQKPVLNGNASEIKLSQNVLLSDSGSYFLMGKISGEVEHGEIFIRATGGSEDKTFLLTSKTTNCKRALLSVHTEGEKLIEISIGLSAGSKGSVMADSLFFFKEKYFNDKQGNVEEMKSLVSEITGIDTFEAVSFDEQVDQVGSSINGSFLKKEIPQNAEIASIYSSEAFNTANTSYLYTFSSDDKIANSYCQKSSLSLDEILKLYKIPVRQIHWQENCSGFHQFTEYYNPFDQQWKLIDVYYGVRYIDEKGDILGFEDVEKLVRKKQFGPANIKQLDIGRLYYNEEEILDGWNKADFAIGIIRK